MPRINRLANEDVVETTFTMRREILQWLIIRSNKFKCTRSSCLDEILEQGFKALGIDMAQWKKEHAHLFDPTKE